MATVSDRRKKPPGGVAGFILAGIAVAFFVLPLIGLVARAPWSQLGDVLTDAVTTEALRLSLVVSLGALLLSIVFGMPLAWVLARRRFPGRGLLRGFIVIPMVLPPVVAGVGLLTALGRRGIVGAPFDDLGVTFSLNTGAAIIAATFVAAPFLILSLEAGFAAVDSRLEEAAATMGASEWRIFRTVTLPAIAPALIAGGALCAARALGEFGATITFAGNLQGRTQTMPLAVFQTLQSDPGAAILMSLLLLGVSFLLLVLLRGRLLAT